MKAIRLVSAAAIALCGFAANANAGSDYVFGFSDFTSTNALTLDGSTVLNNVYSGWYESTGFHDVGNTNYIVGDYGPGYHDFFVFDISALTGPVTSLSLTLFSYSVTSPQTVHFYDVSIPLDTLINGAGGVAAYADLGSGVGYGAHGFSASSVNETFSLNSQAVSALNAAIAGHQRQFAIGGAVGEAVVAVPEPETYALLAGGLGLVAWIARRRKRA
jgi:hypothetical protein